MEGILDVEWLELIMVLKEMDVRKPNLKRNMARVTGSTERVYSGGAIYGGGGASEMRRS